MYWACERNMCNESLVPKHPINKFFTVTHSDYYQLMNNNIAVGRWTVGPGLHCHHYPARYIYPSVAVCIPPHMCYMCPVVSVLVAFIDLWSCATSMYVAPLEDPAYSYWEFHILHMYAQYNYYNYSESAPRIIWESSPESGKGENLGLSIFHH